MTPRAITWFTRIVLVLAALMVVTTFAISGRVSHERVKAPFVVGDTAVADGRDVLAAIQDAIHTGSIRIPTVATVPNVIGACLALLWIVTGGVIVGRQPRNLAGWLFVTVGMAWVAETLGVSLIIWSTIGGGHLPLRGLFAVMGDSSLAPVTLIPLLFLLYPDGHPPPRWGWAMWALLAGAAAVFIGFVLGPGPLNNYVDLGVLYVNPIGIDALSGVAGALVGVGIITIMVTSLATVFAVRGRYRRAVGDERQQMRWLVAVASLAGALLAIGILLTILVSDDSGFTILGFEPFSILLVALVLTIALGVPAAYLVAILRYRLWDLDIVIKKAAIALVLATAIVVVGLLLAANIGQAAFWNETPKPVSALLGVGFGLLLIPLYRVARRIADRLVYGRRATPYEVLTSFSGRIGETYASDDVLARMAQVLATGTGATGARVLVRVGGQEREIASHGEDVGDNTRTPVEFQGEEMGTLVLTMPPNDPMNPAKARLLRDLAAQAGPVLHNVRLLEELRASRRRLVQAQDEERRKLERNIHDGAQQQLVALTRAAEARGRSWSIATRRRHAGARRRCRPSAGTALADLRDLARGIYPPLLADQGLVAALRRRRARRAVPSRSTAADSDGTHRMSRPPCTSARSRPSTTSRSTRTRPTLRIKPGATATGSLRFVVGDDGRASTRRASSYGTGLQGMADRLDAIGGELDGHERAGRGHHGHRQGAGRRLSQPDAASQADSNRSGPNADFGM